MNINYDKQFNKILPNINHSENKQNNSPEKYKEKKPFLTKADRFNL